MPGAAENLRIAVDAVRAHKLRVALTTLGLTMGVATLITVMTLVQGANLYVEQKIANLGTNVFRIARLPFAVTDFTAVVRARRHKFIKLEDRAFVEQSCASCSAVGASASSNVEVRYQERELQDVRLIGHTANMAGIDTRTLEQGRYFTPSEEEHAAAICLIGDAVVREFFTGVNPLGRAIRIGNQECTVVGTFEKVGSVLGQDQDNFAMIPLSTFLKMRGAHQSITLEIKSESGDDAFDRAQDEARAAMRAKRHIGPGRDEDFFIGTADSYISLWQSISGAFFAVFVMVSSISAVVGGIVIMNVMLVSVTERTKEIGIRRAVGATQGDVLRQFLTESVLQCIAGGAVGVVIGFGCALALRRFTDFPAAVQTWVAILGIVLSSGIGLFFGIYPAMKAARLDPVAALRAE